LRDAVDFSRVCQPLRGWLISGGLSGRENDPYRDTYIFDPKSQGNSQTEEFCPAPERTKWIKIRLTII
jgi:hypothetical protein